MPKLYASIEQEAVLHDLFPEEVNTDRLDYSYVTLSVEHWDSGDWSPTLIGPIREDEVAQTMLVSVAALLRTCGITVVTVDQDDED